MHIRRHTTANYQVTAGQVVVDKKETPLIVSIDDVFHSLDSLAHLNIDTILTNPTGYITTLDSLINNLNPNNLNDTVIQSINNLIADLDILLYYANLSDELIEKINNIKNELLELNNSVTVDKLDFIEKNSYVYLVSRKLFFRDGETIYLPQKTGGKQSLYSYCLRIPKDSTKHKNIPFDWIFKGKTVINDTLYQIKLDTSGIYKYTLRNKYDTIKINVDIIDKPIVFFNYSASYNGEFGFEKYEYYQIRTQFISDPVHKPLKIHKREYIPSYASFSAGQTATINTEIIIPNVYDSLKIRFESSDPSVVILSGLVEYDTSYFKKTGIFSTSIKVTSQAKNQTGIDSYVKIYAKDEKNNIIGQLNIQTMKNFTEKIYQIFILLSDSSKISLFDTARISLNLRMYLNAYSYNQIFVEWVPKEKIQIIYLPKDLKRKYPQDTLNENQYTKYYEDIKKRFGAGEDFVKIILSDKVVKTKTGEYEGFVGGSATIKTNFCLIYYTSIYNYSDYIHELGHTQGLSHTFPEPGNPNTKINIGQTNNFMDYSKRKFYFWKWQGNIVRNNNNDNNNN
jgi:hypothetical protein